MARQLQAGQIINRTAVEVGLSTVADPFSTTNEAFAQLVELLNVCGAELAELRDWNELLRSITIDTTNDLTGNVYTLPSDYDRLIPQTGWDQTDDVPVAGPLSPQDWSYLLGRNLASNSIYVSYRVFQGNLEFYPTTVPTGKTLAFQYITRDWAEDSGGNGLDYCTATNDVVRLDPLLMQKFLKVKFLDAKNLPSQAARIEFENVLENRSGNDSGVPILNASRNFRTFPYLNALYNTPDTGFGQ